MGRSPTGKSGLSFTIAAQRGRPSKEGSEWAGSGPASFADSGIVCGQPHTESGNHMKLPQTFPGTAALAAVAMLLTITPAGATIWTEVGDAGNLPGTAQITIGVGPLTSITGTLPDNSDVDMFCIQITDKANFRAAISPLAATVDPDIWLFNANGFGISANNTVTGGQAWVTGANVPSNGMYYLAISSDMASALSAGGAIWNPVYVYTERAPDGPGAAQAITGWGGNPVNDMTSYTVQLTGAGFCEVPEPGSLSVLVAGLCGMLLRRKRRA
jgi:hypothetical protein